MTYKEMLVMIEGRLMQALETDCDNPIYEDHQSRVIANYVQAIKTMKEVIKKDDPLADY